MNTSPLTALTQSLYRQHQRALVILSGTHHWQAPYMHALWTSDKSVLWIGETLPDLPLSDFDVPIKQVKTKQLSHHLGQEVDGVILDASQGLSANTLGIASGMIKGGGLFILLTPPVSDWRTQPNPDNARFLNSPLTIAQAHPYFIDHLIRQWQAVDSQVLWLEQADTEIELDRKIALSKAQICNQDIQNLPTLPTQDQQHALQAIHTVAFGHRKRPLVITADRGRGKSALLGLAAITCLLEGKNHIVLTASRLEQTETAFIQAIKALDKAAETLPITFISKQSDPGTPLQGLVRFEYQSELKTFEFIAPDQLVLVPSTADILMVDEAAHLPTPLLTQLLTRHHRMIFATTLHGYEGSGRGFELRFKKTLNQLTPDWKNCLLTQPIRWADNDPLEKAINQALFLQPDFTCLDNSTAHIEPAELAINIESTDSLFQQPAALHALFSLLVQAHYQTSPNDLQQLLCAPNLKILTAYNQQTLVGVTLCIEEGKIMPTIDRVHGHLVPQLLVKHYAAPDFLMLSSWRIMRIAVHPDCQRQGIGEAMLSQLNQLAIQHKVDYLSSSFGASKELLPFWFKQNFCPIHVGVKRDKASASHNVVVFKSTSAMAQQALASIQRAFQAQFPHTLMESLPYLHASIVMDILQTFKFKRQEPLLEESVIQYRQASRAYESVSAQLWSWSLRNSHVIAKAEQSQQFIWIDKILKKQPWQTVAEHHKLPGRKGVETALREMLAYILPVAHKTIQKPLQSPKLSHKPTSRFSQRN